MPRTIALATALLSATLLCVIAMHGTAPATAGEALPNVTGKWEGTYDFRGGRYGTGPITLHLRQDGTKVTGKQSLVDLIPVWGEQTTASDIVVGEEVREGELMDSTLHFHVTAENVQGNLNFTLTVRGDSMTGTVCGYRCAILKLTKAPM
jgi:hypothetical protein